MLFAYGLHNKRPEYCERATRLLESIPPGKEHHRHHLLQRRYHRPPRWRQPGFDSIKTRILRKEEMFVLQDRVQDVENDNRTKVRLNAKID